MTSPDIRLSNAALRVLLAIWQGPQGGLSGAQISKATSVGSGTLYPLLARLEKAGWLVGDWEAVDPRQVQRPRRRFYRLTALGGASARDEFSKLQVRTGEPQWASTKVF